MNELAFPRPPGEKVPLEGASSQIPRPSASNSKLYDLLRDSTPRRNATRLLGVSGPH